MTPETFLQLADLLPEPTLLVSAGGTVLAANRVCRERLGVRPDALRGRTLAGAVAEPPGAVARYLHHCCRSREMVLGSLTVAGPPPVACRAEGAVLRPAADGAEALVLLRLVPKPSAAGKFVALNRRIDDMGREIRRRREAEDAVRRQEEWLRVTLSSIGDAVIATDAGGRVTFLNPVAEALTGWPRADALGRPLPEVFRIVNEYTRAPGENPAARALREGTVVGLANHTVLIARDGSERPIDDSAAPIRGGAAAAAGAVLVFRYVTGRKQADEALRESEARHRVLADLAAATQPLTDPVEIMAASARLLAEHLGANRCAYAEVEGESVFVITGDHPVGVRSIVGRWPVAAFGAECTRQMRANEPYVVDDAEADPRVTPADRPAYRATDIRAVVCVPLHKGGRFTAAMAVHQAVPRRWTPAEVRLVTAVVGRCWEALARASAGRALAASRARLDYAVRAAGIGFWYCDLPFDVFAWDARVKEHFWLPPDAVVTTDTFYDRLHPDDRERTRAAIDRSIAGRAQYDIQYRTVDPASGAVKWVRALGGAAYGPDGGPARFDGVTTDVTELRRAAEEAREGERRFRRAAAAAAQAAEANAKFRTLFEQGAQFAGVLAPDGTVVEANRLCLDACGFTRDETVGRKFWECGWWSPSPAVAEAVRAACGRAAGGELFRAELTYFVADGSERVIDLIVAPVKDEAGRVLFLSPTGTDVTDQKRAEGELRRQTERLRLLWEAASVLLTTAEPDAMMRGLFAKIAPHFGLDAYFNYTADDAGDALRLESFQGIPDEAARAIRRVEFGRAVCGAVAQSRRPITATGIQESDDPRVQFVKGFGIRAYACNPLLAGDRLLGTLSFASRTRDAFDADEQEFLRTVCHYVTVAYERLRLVRELRASDRKKDDFIALLAHELRNPLAPIRNGVQVVCLSPDRAARERALEMMDRQLGHMVRLIDDLLDVSRVNRNKMELRRARVSLADVLGSAVETARPVIDGAGHELVVALPASPVFLDADLTRLSQVFGNLLTNSAKYTPRGGRIRLSAEAGDGVVAVAVRDDGIGIPAESLPNIFDMFSQVDRSVERSTGGLGIGLALVKGLVEMHGGTVAAESAGQGQGSAFTVTLPTLAAQPVAAGPAAGDAPAAARARRRILVVDDNRDGAESLAMVLELLGNEVRTAHDGVAAVAAAEAFRPEVILMDVGMPRMNGYEATRRIRGQPWGQGIVILALTGWGQAGDREQSRQAGCDGHMVKPVSLPDLERRLGEV